MINKKCKDLTGRSFGRLSVVEFSHRDKYRQYHWKCSCKCGNSITVRAKSLLSGNTRSCGCLKRESHNVKHGMRGTRLYGIWSGIKARCYRKSDQAYSRYGGRGITMDSLWRNDFMSFYNWAIANGYKDTLSIDRIDVNGNYEPSNCRWTTPQEQSDNKRNNILITINGETLDLQQWCDRFGINRSTVNTRVRICGWNYVSALTTPVREHKEYSSRKLKC